MWSNSFVLIVINVLIFWVHSLPPNIDWNALRNDPDSIAQNEKILQLFLQLAMRTANRLTRLKKEIEKKDSCNKHNDNLSSSTSEVFVTQLPFQETLDRLDENQEIQNHLSSDLSGDSEIKDNQTLLENSDQNQTASDQQLQESFDSSTQNINRDGDIASTLDSKTSNLIQESVEDVQDTLSNVTGHSNETINFDTLQTPSLDLSTTNNSLNANESGADVRDLKPVEDGISQRLFNPIELGKNIANTSVINDLTKTVNEFFPELEKLQKSPLGINQSTGLIQSVPKIISDVQKNVNQLHNIPQLHNALSGTIDGISSKILDPSIIKNFESILSPQIMNNFPVVNQILSSTRNFAELMFKILPMAIKTTNNLLNQIVSESQNIHEMFNITEENNQEIKTSNLPTNVDNSTIDDSNNVPALLNDRKDSSIPLFRSFPDFNQHENNKSETDLSSTQTDENANRFIDKKLLIKSNETDHHAGQVDEEIRDEEFKKINETETDDRDKQLNTFSENLSNKNGENELKEIATSPNQLESALIPITEVKSSNDTQDLQNSENVNDIVKSNVNETRRPQEDLLSNSERNQISHIINNLSELSDYRTVIDNLKKENLHEQLSEAKLQEIDVRLINALWPIIEKRMSGNASYVTDYYNEQKNKNFPSNISFDSQQTIDEQGSNHIKNQVDGQVVNSTLRFSDDQDYSRRETTSARR